MSDHLADFVAYVMGEDKSELGRTKAELAYALHSLEREIAIAQDMQRQNAALVKALDIARKMIAGEIIEAAVIDTQTMEGLGSMIDRVLDDLIQPGD